MGILGNVIVDGGAKLTVCTGRDGKVKFYRYKKNGFTVYFKPQNSNEESRISSSDKGKLELSNLDGITVFGSDREDLIKGVGILNSKFYTDNDDKKDVIEIDNYKSGHENSSYGNEVTLGSEDKMRVRTKDSPAVEFFKTLYSPSLFGWMISDEHYEDKAPDSEGKIYY